MSSLEVVDIVVLVGYFVVTLGIGYWVSTFQLIYENFQLTFSIHSDLVFKKK